MLLRRLSDSEAVIPAIRRLAEGIQPIGCHSEGEARRISFQWLFKRSFAALRMTIGLLLFILIPTFVSAAAPAKIPLPNPLGTTNILDLGARLIQAGLGIAGSLALLFFIYGGFLWLTSAGVPDKIKKGRDVFLWSTVGLVIIFSSYLMVDFVIKAITANYSKSSPTADCQIIAQTKKQECAEPCQTKDPAAAASCDAVCEAEYKINLNNCLGGDPAVIAKKKCVADIDKWKTDEINDCLLKYADVTEQSDCNDLIVDIYNEKINSCN